MFCIGIVLAGILQAVMWLPADGNLPTSFVFALLYGITGVGAIGMCYNHAREIIAVLSMTSLVFGHTGVAPAVLAVHLDHSKLASLIGVFFTCEIAGFLTGPSIAGAVLARADYRAVIGYSCGYCAKPFSSYLRRKLAYLFCLVLASCVLADLSIRWRNDFGFGICRDSALPE